MQDTPFASFCFSTYKRPEYLKATLKSIQRQTLRDYEVIVSDNDIDESGRIAVESLGDERFKYYPNGENLGMKKSFNKSLERSRGQFIVMIADDDPVYPDMLETLYNLSVKLPGYGMYLGGCDWFCTDPEVGRLYNFKVGTNSCLSDQHELDHIESYSPANFLKQLYSFGIFPHYLWSTCIVRRETLIRIGGVPEYGTAFLGDYAYLSAVGAVSGCVVMNRSLGCQTLHRENFGRNQNEQILTAATNFPIYIEEKAGYLDEWKHIKPLMMRFVALWIVSHLSFLYSYYKISGNIDPSFRDAEKAIFKLPFMKKYRLKYFLKKRVPFIHNLLVRVKKKFKI